MSWSRILAECQVGLICPFLNLGMRWQLRCIFEIGTTYVRWWWFLVETSIIYISVSVFSVLNDVNHSTYVRGSGWLTSKALGSLNIAWTHATVRPINLSVFVLSRVSHICIIWLTIQGVVGCRFWLLNKNHGELAWDSFLPNAECCFWTDCENCILCWFIGNLRCCWDPNIHPFEKWKFGIDNIMYWLS